MLSVLSLKMSKEVKVLSHGEVQKKILENPPKVRPQWELIGPFNRYRDEDFEIYNKKKRQFLETCKKYYRLNQETLVSSKQRLMEDYRQILDCEFLEDEKEEAKVEPGTQGNFIRKRTTRSSDKVPHSTSIPCTMEPWFTRHLKLNKFIWAGRTIILQNRLLKVLEKLSTVTQEDIEVLEKCQRKYVNVSYAEIFEKFM